jgi:hypothetical protein
VVGLSPRHAISAADTKGGKTMRIWSRLISTRAAIALVLFSGGTAPFAKGAGKQTIDVVRR